MFPLPDSPTPYYIKLRYSGRNVLHDNHRQSIDKPETDLFLSMNVDPISRNSWNGWQNYTSSTSILWALEIMRMLCRTSLIRMQNTLAIASCQETRTTVSLYCLTGDDTILKMRSNRIDVSNLYHQIGMSRKSIERLFPCDNSMVVVLDDRADVWHYSPNLVKVHPCKMITVLTKCLVMMTFAV